MSNSDSFSELSLLIVTVAILAMITLLLILHIVPANDALIVSTVGMIGNYWFLSHAFKWQGPSAATSTQSRVSGAYTPRASALQQGQTYTTRPVPPQGGSVIADPTQPDPPPQA